MSGIVLKLALALCGTLLAAAFPAAKADEQPSFDSVIERLSEITVLRGRYAQIREIPALSAPLQSAGHFLVSEQGLYWQQETPFSMVLVAQDERLSQAVADQPMVTVTAADQPVALAVARVFLGIFQGRRDLLGRHFDIGFESADDSWSIMLEPSAAPLSEALDSVLVEGTQFIERLTIRGRAGDLLTVSFSELESAPLSAEERELFDR